MQEKILIIFELANNHGGSVETAIQMIENYSRVVEEYPLFEFAFKLQKRHLQTFLHQDAFQMIPGYTKRFQETDLSIQEHKQIYDAIRLHNCKVICTPFDEQALYDVEPHIDIIKIGAPSFADWPLLNAIAMFDKPIIMSTGGADEATLEKVVSFFLHRNKDLTLLHCVSEYPSCLGAANINIIKWLKKRYPGIQVGLSSHEDLDLRLPGPLAMAKGARVFERHIGDGNAYSLNPHQADRWLNDMYDAYIMLGAEDLKASRTENEYHALRGFQRGLFLKHKVESGEVVTSDDFYLAWPIADDEQYTARSASKYAYFTMMTDLNQDEPLTYCNAKLVDQHASLRHIITNFQRLVAKFEFDIANYRVPLDVSYQRGLSSFFSCGMCSMTIINNDQYCKKLMFVFPNQIHPTQVHQKKTESYILLRGKLQVRIMTDDAVEPAVHFLEPGDILTIYPNEKHAFVGGDNGAIIEEISTNYDPDDSHYLEEVEQNRKTTIEYWWD